MPDDKKLKLPSIKRGGAVANVPVKKVVRPLDLSKKATVSRILGSQTSVVDDIARREAGLDLVLAGDLTGSMGRYHGLLKEKFSELCNELFPMIKNLKMGIVFYLDHGSMDPYVTRVCELTKNVQELQNFINATSTGCGGDEDEAVEDALNDIVNMNWREIGNRNHRNRSVVLFGDARPHEPGHCPSQYSYFDLTKQMAGKGIIVNSVYCDERNYTAEQLQKLEDVGVGDFSKRVSDMNHPNFFSWVANVTGGMIIGIEQIDDLIEIIKAAAAKDSGHLDEYEATLKKTAPMRKLNLVKVAKKAQARRIAAEEKVKRLGLIS